MQILQKTLSKDGRVLQLSKEDTLFTIQVWRPGRDIGKKSLMKAVTDSEEWADELYEFYFNMLPDPSKGITADGPITAH